MRMYRVVHTSNGGGYHETKSYLSDSPGEAWWLWLELTRIGESDRRERARTARIWDRSLSEDEVLSQIPRGITVQIFDLDGHELCPEKGMPGMCEYRCCPAT